MVAQRWLRWLAFCKVVLKAQSSAIELESRTEVLRSEARLMTLDAPPVLCHRPLPHQ